MKLKGKPLKKIIKTHNLKNRDDVVSFIRNNPEQLSVDELSRVAELVNNQRVETAAYYTDFETLKNIYDHLPIIEKQEIRILEPSVGTGNFIQLIINKYSNATKKLIIDVNDIDRESIEITKLLNQLRKIPSNVEINYINVDFITHDFEQKFDLIIGNPPFLKMSKNSKVANLFEDHLTKNMSGFFVQKSLKLADHVVMIMPKYFLNNPDFKLTRERVNQTAVKKIIDFGEKGFKGVLIETIVLFLNTKEPPNLTETYSITRKIKNIVEQSKMTSEEYPYWLLYRNDFFETIANEMRFGVFTSFRDRQLTNSIVNSSGDIQVLKSRNINRDGSGITSLKGYDTYISSSDLNKFTVSKYIDRDDVYLCPNMTYYPRVIKKPKGFLVNGSVAILEKKGSIEIKDEHIKFLSSEIFEEFYRIARNYSTRSLNIDSNSIYFFGLYK